MGVLLGNAWRAAVLGVVFSLAVLPSIASGQAPKRSTGHVPVVEDLIQLLQARPDLRAALEGAIRTADLKGFENTEALLDQLDDMIATVPNAEQHRPPRELDLYYLSITHRKIG